jgi:hypothetical protein
MLHSSGETKNWKMDQIHYFREYLKAFQIDTREYNLIKQGIEELERSV